MDHDDVDDDRIFIFILILILKSTVIYNQQLIENIQNKKKYRKRIV